MRCYETSLPLWQEVQDLLSKLLILDMDVRDQAREELAELDREQVIDVLSVVLANENPEEPQTRYNAAWLLCEFSPKLAARLFIPHLESPDPILRWKVCGLLSSCGDNEATMPVVNVLLNDPEAATRMLAAFTLEKIGDRRAIPALRWAQQHDDGTDWEGRRMSDAAADAIDEILKRYSNTDDSTAE
jgi:HEAT repeat protein